MFDLNNISDIKKLDKYNVLGSIEQLSLQCEQAWSQASQLKFPNKYRYIKNIVFSGMGGSALGAYVVKSLFLDKLNIPFEIINEYHLPKFADKNTLVILSSYSGTTEETLSTLKEAIEKKCLVSGLTSGGKLAAIFAKEKIPAYIYTPKYNPSNQPRMGLGYPIFGLLAILNKLKLLEISETELLELKQMLNQGNLVFGVKSLNNNIAKKLAQQLFHKLPIIVFAEFLTNVGRVIRNQFHENAKQFACCHEIPELNHHLMEGLKHPKTNSDNLFFIFFNSKLYSPRIQKRFTITKDVVGKNNIKYFEYNLIGKTQITQSLEAIQLGAYINYYLALLYNIDPSKIPWVDYFKAELKK